MDYVHCYTQNQSLTKLRSQAVANDQGTKITGLLQSAEDGHSQGLTNVEQAVTKD